ncbi:phospholipid-translocating P-type ATPase [Metarhizium robertsii]|uniref:Phospholipid-transporting ATPase n=2 Tax=Metarhizium robertsii TaxID=568076 RepID=E9F0U0_METRA|nr:ATPase, P-type, phospholipid-translocating, flippase [Metarhizium robertsii ARSEF 23]EFY98750.2 ATPase, P-type, phospholipid-translocating, flippase [Metarhizium robertsii ARSEF 23]EXV04093.1 phospholipid-translocating P-type ATPase [Metarhizium robertsii]
MAGRPTEGRHGASSGNRDDLLLDLDNDQPLYGGGQRSALNDDDLMRRYSHDQEEPQSRPSVSYDDFVGASTSSATRSGARGIPPPGQGSTSPYMSRQYSQTSELGNYQRYADDFEDYPIDGDSYYQHGGSIPANARSTAARSNARNRNSVLSLGGGFFGRVKNKLGMGQGYSEMDLPLTEGGHERGASSGGSPPDQRSKGFDMGNFKFGFGRSKPDPSTLGPRIIHLNNPPANSANKYVDNHISTAKYNIATFLPKFLLEQFSKFANVFFLFTAGLQQIPGLSPTNRYTTIAPLLIVLLISAGKELVEDYRRKQADNALNTSKARVLRGSSFTETNWINVAVGDIVRVESEEPFPADLVLLASSEPEGLCYIETANLDGETNLKIKQALPETSSMVSSSELSRLGGRIKSEQPNSSLYTYEATLTMQTGPGEKELALNPEQLLLRGATLRNTPWIHGVVVFTGHETKLMRNATATPIKRTKVEKKLNWLVLVLIGMLLALSVVCTVGDLIMRGVNGDSLGYLYLDKIDNAGTVVKTFARDMVTYWVLFSSLVPISLFVTVELVKYWHGILINDDLDMYYDKADTPATCRTSSLVEELGMVEFVFSDKTGTLTCNQMEFKQCTIAGLQYADEVPEDRRATGPDDDTGIHNFDRLRSNLKNGHDTAMAIDHFLTLLATCHTVIPEMDEKGHIKYQAASPDEGALVQGALDLGYRFTARKPRSVIIEAAGQEMEYELLAVCEFNSTRKRMSAIYRCPDGKVRIYCKGADTVILERLNDQNPHVEATLQHLEEYASEGLRTLCLAMREVPEQEFSEWQRIFDAASTTVGGTRADELDKAAEIIEHDFFLLGATAIEDRLQDGVPETIHTLQEANIKVWVLTGDRQETAINIGMSCKLLSEDMMLLIVNEETAAATRDNIQKKLDAIRTQGDGTIESETLALVIDGKSLTYALEQDLEKLFLDLAIMCKAVVCCRVSPLQKALVVKLVKKYQKSSILLAIGDGANDVSMIQAAHIGIGISGMEGLQAARSADVAIAQFRYLRKLLLVHGAWSYQRVSKTILFSFYKNITLYLTQFWFTFQNVFSGQVIYESWTLSFYNVFYTVLPPLVLGILDQYISARLLDRYPPLYGMGQSNSSFKLKTFAQWIANAFYHSIILYVWAELFWYGDLIQGDGKIAGHWVWGTALYGAVLLTVLGKAALVTSNWTKYHVLAIPGSMAIWYIFIAAYGSVAPKVNFSMEYHGVVPRLYTSPVFWLQTVVLAFMCLLRDFVWKYAKRMYLSKPYHHIQELQKYNIQDYRPRMEQFQKAIRKVRQVQRMRKQRGYAFSQADESQTRVLQAYDTTKHRGRYGEMASSRTPAR